MAARRPKPLRRVAGLPVIAVEDPNVDRAISVVRDAVMPLIATRQRDVLTADLVIGANRVRHGLGRPAVGYSITPSVATIAFAHAINRTNAHPEFEIVIDVVGSDMPNATLEVW